MVDIEGSSRISPGPRASYPDLAGRVAVVTGAARGMGAKFAEQLAAAGVSVLAADINESVHEFAESFVPTTEGTIEGVTMDVTDRAQHQRVADLAVERFGHLDIWVNNAGVFPAAEVMDITPEQLRTTFAINVEGVLFGAQAAASAMGPRGGAIVNMSSGSAFRVRATRATYSISKAAVDHLTRFLSLELAPRGIRVNAIAPGFVDTEMTQWAKADAATFERSMASIPLGRMARPDEVAAAMMFLVSDVSSYVTGTTIIVDGGSRNTT